MKKLFVKTSTFILFILITGCSSSNFVPVRPLKTGEEEIRFSFHYSPNKFDLGSFQLSLFHGVSDYDVIGTSLANFIVPNLDKPETSKFKYQKPNKSQFSNF